MALLADSSADVNSNFSSSGPGSSMTFTMPSNLGIKVESVVATIDNAAGGANLAKVVVRDSAGEVVSTVTQGSTIPAGDTGTASFSLRLGGTSQPLQVGQVRVIYDYTVSGSDKASIDTGVDGAGAAPFPTDLNYLEVYLTGRTDEAVFVSDVSVFFNNDTASTNYTRSYISSTTATGHPDQFQVTAGATFAGVLAGGNAAAGVAGLMRLFIPNYNGTTFYKTAEFTAWSTDTVAGLTHYQVSLENALWSNTAALSRIKMQPFTAGKKFKVGTRMTIWAR